MAHLPLTVLALLFLSRIGSFDNGTAVRLIQPAARSSERGFNVIRNAEAPCPTTRTVSDTKNFVKSGKELEFVWFNPTAVKGIFRIQLLNANYELISTLLDSDKPATFETNGLSTSKVIVPETECKDCIFRLVQETADGKAQLLSCADVDIVENLPSSVKKCEGDECTVECTKDVQCGTGSCIKGSCYCSEGNYGPGCFKESHIVPKQLNLSNYASISSSFAAKNKLYWKIENDEIELVLKFPTNTWTVFGFKPSNVADKCPWLDAGLEKKKLKSDGSNDNSLDGFGKELKIRKINDVNKTFDIHGCVETEFFSNCPEYSRECEASCDWTAFPESIPTCPRACGEARCVCKEGLVRAGNNKNECVAFNVCQEDVAVECPQNETWAKCGTACEPTCDSMYDTAPCNQKCFKPACTCADNYVRLNGECVFWSNCPNLEQKILNPSNDSNRTATPPNEPPTTVLATTKHEITTISPVSTTIKEDSTVAEKSLCPANETMNECGKICEADCVSIFVRDECKECDKPACACQQGFARNGDHCVYWGDCPFDGNGFETIAPKSTFKEVLEATKPTTAPKIAAVKSAILEKPNKIQESLIEKSSKFVEPIPAGKSEIVGDVCFGEWRWPRNCRNNCDYKLSWNLNEEIDEIEFSLETKVSNNWWTGVGFSKGGSMKNADLIVVKVKDGSLSLHDMFSFDYDAPVEDENKNVYSPTIIGSFVNGVLRTQFTRKRDTKDNVTDVTFSDKECYHFLFPVTGGRLDSHGNVLKHISTPHVSPFPVCIRSCEIQVIEEKQEPKCGNEYRFPENCEGDECEYIAKWNLIPTKDEVKFEIKSRGIGRWSGIGISKTGLMENSDIYTGWVFDGKAYIVDRFAFGKQLPAIDPADRQDIYDLGGKIDDDYQTIWFTRKIITNDKLTDFSLDGCYYFLFPIGGGRVLARKTSDFQNSKTPIGYHDLNQPKISKTKICICDEHDIPIAAIPNRVRARRQVANPFEEKVNEQPFVGLPDMAMIGQISIAELTGKASYDVKMDPFACSDVTVLKVLDGGNSRVVDAFAQSKYGLEPDEFFGGLQSYFDIIASENDGEATVRFKRSLKAGDVADHEFLTGKSQIFWANGPPEDSSVRLSGAAHVEILFVDFFDNTKIPVIADLEDEITITSVSAETTTKKIEQTTTENVEETTTEEPTTVEIKETTIKVKNPEIVTPSFVQVTTTKEKTTEPMGFFEETTMEATTTESNVIDELDSGEEEISESPRINLESPMCHGSFVHPPKCTTNCNYVLSWNTDGIKVDFNLWSKLQTEMWTGVGFSTEGGMMNADAIIISILKDGTVNVSDQFSPNYGRPKIDKNQDVFDISTFYSDGELRANFSRSLSTKDDAFDVDLQECQFFLFMQSGGKLEGGSNDLRKHVETPISSGSRICLGKCRAKEETLKESKTPETIVKKPKDSENTVMASGPGSVIVPPLKPPTHFVYDAVLRFTNLKYSDSLNDMNSDESKKLSNMITDQLGSLLKSKWSQLKKFKVLKFASGSVKTLIQMEFDGADSPTPKQVEEYLRELAKSGKTGEFQVDPKELILKENKTRAEKEEEMQWKNFRNWAMLIGALILISIPILIALCCCFRRRRRQTYPTQPMSFAPPMHKPYMSSPYISEPIYDIKNSNRHPLASPKSSASPKGHTPDETPKGMGETTYQEWYTKVACKDAPTHHQESTLSVAASRPHSRMSAISGSPYISYPHETGYYTLGGEHRVPPPSYYRHY